MRDMSSDEDENDFESDELDEDFEEDDELDEDIENNKCKSVLFNL